MNQYEFRAVETAITSRVSSEEELREAGNSLLYERNELIENLSILDDEALAQDCLINDLCKHIKLMLRWRSNTKLSYHEMASTLRKWTDENNIDVDIYGHGYKGSDVFAIFQNESDLTIAKIAFSHWTLCK